MLGSSTKAMQGAQLLSVTFFVTADLTACFPSRHCRRHTGWTRWALLDCQQMAVDGDLARCIGCWDPCTGWTGRRACILFAPGSLLTVGDRSVTSDAGRCLPPLPCCGLAENGVAASFHQPGSEFPCPSPTFLRQLRRRRFRRPGDSASRTRECTFCGRPGPGGLARLPAWLVAVLGAGAVDAAASFTQGTPGLVTFRWETIADSNRLYYALTDYGRLKRSEYLP